MTKNIQKGDLVWIPQDVRLHWFKNNDEKFRYLVTAAPVTAIVCETRAGSYDVFTHGNVWTVNQDNTYYIEAR